MKLEMNKSNLFVFYHLPQVSWELEAAPHRETTPAYQAKTRPEDGFSFLKEYVYIIQYKYICNI